MAITKEYLDSIRFDIAKQKYYNANKVDARLDELKQQVLELLAENESLHKAIEDVGSAKDEIGVAVINAQARAKSAVEEAESEAAGIIARAKTEAAALNEVAKAEADAIVAGAKTDADKLLNEAKLQANIMVEQAKEAAAKYAPVAGSGSGSDAFSLKQLEAIDKINKQLDELNVTHATQIFRLKQALMTMATEK